MLNKLLNKGDRKKTYLPAIESSFSIKYEGKHKINSTVKLRRAEQVSKVLFSYISDLIQYGDENFPQIEETIEISKVKMSPDFSALVVHWLATGTPKDDIIQHMLRKNSGKIRQHLINLNFVSTLPPITFVADLSEVQYQIVANLLQTADMGPESDQLSGENLLKHQPQISSKCINGSLEKQINENLYEMKKKHLSDGNNKEIYKDLLTVSDETDSNLVVLNQFENDVYELDHTSLMQLVQEKQTCGKIDLIKNVPSNEKFTEQYFKTVAKRKTKNIPKLKEYTYYDYLKEESIND